MSSGAAMMVPAGPRATRKRKAGSITSGYLVKRKERKRSELETKPWIGYCDSQFGLPLSLTSSTLGGQLLFAASAKAS